MPLYEYECESCHRRLEKRQKFSDAELTDCPHCGGALHKTITAPAVMFKGGGWYADGYGSKKSTASGSGGDGGTSGGDAGSSSSGEASTTGTPSTPAASTPSTPSTTTSAPATTTPSS